MAPFSLALAVTASAGAAHAKPATNGASTATTRTARAVGKIPLNDRIFTATTSTGGSATTLRVTLKANSDGSPLKLTRAERNRIAAIIGVPAAGRGAVAEEDPSSSERSETLTAQQREAATLRCDKNPSWSDSNGTLSARFNCKHSTINWGYRISSRVQSIISGRVVEQGVSWWNNGKRMPRNAGHVTGKNYHFHGTLKPVVHGNNVHFQDYMTFRVNIGGKTGTGSLVWASNVKAKK